MCATRKGWSERMGSGDATLKFSLSSSGCETRPAKVEPDRPVAGSATASVTTSAMREHANERAVGSTASKPWISRMSKTYTGTKTAAERPKKGDGRAASGGVVGHGALEEDGPGTWEALQSPRESNGPTGSPTRISDGPASTDARDGRSRTSVRSRGRPKARETGAEADGGRASEGGKVAWNPGNDRHRTRGSEGPAVVRCAARPRTRAGTNHCGGT